MLFYYCEYNSHMVQGTMNIIIIYAGSDTKLYSDICSSGE